MHSLDGAMIGGKEIWMAQPGKFNENVFFAIIRQKTAH